MLIVSFLFSSLSFLCSLLCAAKPRNRRLSESAAAASTGATPSSSSSASPTFLKIRLAAHSTTTDPTSTHKAADAAAAEETRDLGKRKRERNSSIGNAAALQPKGVSHAPLLKVSLPTHQLPSPTSAKLFETDETEGSLRERKKSKLTETAPGPLAAGPHVTDGSVPLSGTNQVLPGLFVVHLVAPGSVRGSYDSLRSCHINRLSKRLRQS